MVKPTPPVSGDMVARVREQREIRDVHTLVAKLASEAVTLQSWTEQPPSDEVDAKIQQTITTFASGLAGDASRLAGSLGEDEEARQGAKAPGTGLTVDKSV